MARRNMTQWNFGSTPDGHVRVDEIGFSATICRCGHYLILGCSQVDARTRPGLGCRTSSPDQRLPFDNDNNKTIKIIKMMTIII